LNQKRMSNTHTFGIPLMKHMLYTKILPGVG